MFSALDRCVIRCAVTKHIDTNPHQKPPAARSNIIFIDKFYCASFERITPLMTLFVRIMFRSTKTDGLNAFPNMQGIAHFFVVSSNNGLWTSNRIQCVGMSHRLNLTNKLIFFSYRKNAPTAMFFFSKWDNQNLR